MRRSNPAVAVVTDSAAALSPADIAHFTIAVVPLRLRVDGTLFHEGVNISSPRVVAELTAGKRVEVLEPTAEEIGKAYRQASYTGARGTVSVHLAAAMHDAAAQARAAAASAGVDVRVLDTGTVAMAQGLVALANPGVVVSLIGGSAAEEGLLIDVTGAHAEASPGVSLTAHSGPGTYVVAVADMPACYTP